MIESQQAENNIFAATINTKKKNQEIKIESNGGIRA